MGHYLTTKVISSRSYLSTTHTTKKKNHNKMNETLKSFQIYLQNIPSNTQAIQSIEERNE